MLKKLSVLIDKTSGEEWTIRSRTVSNKVPDPTGNLVQLYVYVLQNERNHKRFVYEHLLEREFEEKPI